MSKPISKKDAHLREQYNDPQPNAGCRDIDREKRRLKKEAKRARTKHLRTLGKRKIKEKDDE